MGFLLFLTSGFLFLFLYLYLFILFSVLHRFRLLGIVCGGPVDDCGVNFCRNSLSFFSPFFFSCKESVEVNAASSELGLQF